MYLKKLIYRDYYNFENVIIIRIIPLRDLEKHVIKFSLTLQMVNVFSLSYLIMSNSLPQLLKVQWHRRENTLNFLKPPQKRITSIYCSVSRIPTHKFQLTSCTTCQRCGRFYLRLSPTPTRPSQSGVLSLWKLVLKWRCGTVLLSDFFSYYKTPYDFSGVGQKLYSGVIKTRFLNLFALICNYSIIY